MPTALKFAIGVTVLVLGLAIAKRPALAEGTCDYLVPEICSSSIMTICFPEYPGGPIVCDEHRVDIMGRKLNDA